MRSLYFNGGVIGSTLDYNSSIDSYVVKQESYKKPYRVFGGQSLFFPRYTSTVYASSHISDVIPGDFLLVCAWTDIYNDANVFSNMSITGLTQLSKITTGTTSTYKNVVMYIGYKFITEADLSTQYWNNSFSLFTNSTTPFTQSDYQYTMATVGVYRNVNTVTPIGSVVTNTSTGSFIPPINSTSITPPNNDCIIVLGTGGAGTYNPPGGVLQWPNFVTPSASYGTFGQRQPFSPGAWYQGGKTYEVETFTPGSPYTPSTLPYLSISLNSHTYQPASIGFKLILNGANEFTKTKTISNKRNSGIWNLNSVYESKLNES